MFLALLAGNPRERGWLHRVRRSPTAALRLHRFADASAAAAAIKDRDRLRNVRARFELKLQKGALNEK
jgi:hypothetical protein